MKKGVDNALRLVPYILNFVSSRYGPINSFESWRKAYSSQKYSDFFKEIDEGITGKSYDWERRSPSELAIYVLFLNFTQKFRVDIEFQVNRITFNLNLDDSEMIFSLWFIGFFRYLDNCEIPEKALEYLFYHADYSNYFKTKIYDPDLKDDVEYDPYSDYFQGLVSRYGIREIVTLDVKNIKVLITE